MWKVLLVLPLVFVVAAACGDDDDGGGGGDGQDRDALAERVERSFDILVSEDVEEDDIAAFVASNCRETVPILLGAGELLRGLLPEGSEIGVEVTDIDFEGDDRALVVSDLRVDGESVDDESDPDAQLWVRENGSWNLADDCEFYGTLEE